MSSQKELPDPASGKADDQAKAASPCHHQASNSDKEVSKETSQELRLRTDIHLRVVLVYTFVLSLFAVFVVGTIALLLIHDPRILGVFTTVVSFLGFLIVKNLFPGGQSTHTSNKRDGPTIK